ncbi:hypothetical protein P9112_006266 [Eukaryota sp. TZLM1-RC]
MDNHSQMSHTKLRTQTFATEAIALHVPLRLLASAKKTLSPHLLGIKGVSSIRPCPEDTTIKYVLVKHSDPLPCDVLSFLASHSLTHSPYTLHRSYDELTVAEALRHLLPSSIPIPSSYETVGHLIHLNLLEEHEPFKFDIGRVFLDKIKSVKTVVNKSSSISNQFRVFPMEFLAGEENTIVKVKENGIIFSFDFKLVYWNSRLHKEHERLVNHIIKQSNHQSNHSVADVFAGIGPFVLPLSKELNGVIYANDLNPDSVKFMKQSISLNKISNDNLQIFNLDGKEFIGKMMEKEVQPDHFILNLPANSIDFVEEFKKYEIRKKIEVHIYAFSRQSDPCDDVINQIVSILGNIEVRGSFIVRDVAPNKSMVRVDFALNSRVSEVPPIKQKRVE